MLVTTRTKHRHLQDMHTTAAGVQHLKSGLPYDLPLMAIPRRRISLLVSVPVLSEKTYAARPRSSMMLLLRALAHCRVLGSRISGSRKMKYAWHMQGSR